MPSVSHGGVRAEVRLASAVWTSSWAIDRAALVRAAVAVGAPEDEHALAPDLVDALRRALGRVLVLGDRGQRLQRLDVLGQRLGVGAGAGDDDEHLLRRLDARQAALHAVVALLQVGHQAADLQALGREREEVRALARLVGRVLPGREHARRRPVVGDPPPLRRLHRAHPRDLEIGGVDVVEAVAHLDAHRRLVAVHLGAAGGELDSLIGSAFARAICVLSLGGGAPSRSRGSRRSRPLERLAALEQQGDRAARCRSWASP